MQIQSRIYQLSRFEMAALSAKEYLRTFWWYVAIIPTFGLFALLFATGPLQMVGLMALLFPITIPGRAFLSSSKSSRLFTQPLFMEADEQGVTFYSQATEPKRLRFVIRAVEIRDLVDRGDILLLRTRKLGFAPIKKEAFESPQQMVEFGVMIEQMVERRLASVPDA